MRLVRLRCAVFAALLFGVICIPAVASVRMGMGNESLIGGDLTDPGDKLNAEGDYAGGKTEEESRPAAATWVTIKTAPLSPPGTAPHSRHVYHNWQGQPACSIFLNQPEKRIWYVGFKDGGFGGPTQDAPYYTAVQLKNAYKLTHFTITSAQNMPDRDPKSWAIQGSNSGEDDDWTDIYRCKNEDRTGSALRESPRGETTLYVSFTSATMDKVASPADAKKLQGKLKGLQFRRADFPEQTKAYTWFRIVVTSCYNPNGTDVEDHDRPPGFQIGQLELFGTPGQGEAPVVKAPEAPATPPVVDAPFMISYWCGPPKDQTTLERYKEIAECGFNTVFPAIDNLWEPASKDQEEHNRKYLDLCQQVGLKALLWDGAMIQPEGWKPPAPEEVPGIEKAMDGIVERYSAHPALLGYIVIDEPGPGAFDRIGVVNQYLLKKDPKHVPYINLLPNYGVPGSPSYEKGIVQFLKKVKPALLSWDHYRQMFETGDEKCYWDNLETVRRHCLKAKVPYNQIIVSFRHMGYRECNEADLRWQVWTSLAYGSRGIQYFTYWFVPGLAWADAPALISKEGKRDVKWDYVKKINNRIAKLGPTLVKLTSTGVYCTDPLPIGTRGLTEDAPVKKAEGGTLVIGCFKDADGGEYIMPVNRSFTNVITTTLTLDAKFASAAEISQETGKPIDATPVAEQPLYVSLEPGEGKLFQLNPKAVVAPK
ncbi:MAG: discoidin domain-containing protein [Planctomycetota bacterium]